MPNKNWFTYTESSKWYLKQAYQIREIPRISTKIAFPAGLPPSYTMMFVLKYDVTRKSGKLRALKLMAITDSVNNDIISITANPKSNYLEFQGITQDDKTVSLRFSQERYTRISELFNGEFHKLLIHVNPGSVTLYLDCERLGTRHMRLLKDDISIDGQVVLASNNQNRGYKSLSLQTFEIYCSGLFGEEVMCCDIPGKEHADCPGEPIKPTEETTTEAPPPTTVAATTTVEATTIYQTTVDPFEAYRMGIESLIKDEMENCACPVGPVGEKGSDGRAGIPGRSGPIGRPGKEGIKREGRETVKV